MSTLTMSVDEAWLRGLDACDEEYDMFCEEWPNGAEVSKANLDRADVLGMNIQWFACNVLPKVVFDECKEKHYPFLKEFERSSKIACEQYSLRRSEYYAEFSARLIEHPSIFAISKFETVYNANIVALLIRYQDDVASFKNEYTTKCNTLFIACIVDYYASKGKVL